MWNVDWGMWSESRYDYQTWLTEIQNKTATVTALDKNPNTNIIIDSECDIRSDMRLLLTLCVMLVIQQTSDTCSPLVLLVLLAWLTG